MVSQNPFTVGLPVPPERFVGRSRLLATAFDQIFQPGHGNLAIWGGSGIGKTSFLELLTAPQTWQDRGHDPSTAVIVMIDCLSIYPFTGSGFWRKILSLMKNELEGEQELQGAIDVLLQKAHNSHDDLAEILHQLGEQERFLVLLVDNYDAALRIDEQYSAADMEKFLSQCRTIAYSSEQRKYLSMIVASSRRLNELGPRLTPDKSPWYNHYLFRQIKPFTDSEIDKLLVDMPRTPALRDGIREIADGHPVLLQNAGYLLYEELQAGGTPDPVTFVREFQNATTPFFQQTWELSNEIEQTLLMLLALCKLEGRLQKKRYDLRDIEVIFSQKEIELNALAGRGVLKYTVEADDKIYSFASSIMEWWVVKQIENSDEKELQERQKVFLNLMSHKQAEKVMIFIRWLWQNKDKVPPIVEWIRKLF